MPLPSLTNDCGLVLPLAMAEETVRSLAPSPRATVKACVPEAAVASARRKFSTEMTLPPPTPLYVTEPELLLKASVAAPAAAVLDRAVPQIDAGYGLGVAGQIDGAAAGDRQVGRVGNDLRDAHDQGAGGDGGCAAERVAGIGERQRAGAALGQGTGAGDGRSDVQGVGRGVGANNEFYAVVREARRRPEWPRRRRPT